MEDVCGCCVYGAPCAIGEVLLVLNVPAQSCAIDLSL